MIKFYQECIDPEYQEQVAKQLSLTSQEQYQINEELAVKRVVNKDAIKLYFQAKEHYERTLKTGTNDEKRIASHILTGAADALTTALQDTAVLADKASTIAVKVQDKVSVNTLAFFMTQIESLVQDIFFDGTANTTQRIDYFKQQAREVLVLKEADVNELQPVLEYTAMVESVPEA